MHGVVEDSIHKVGINEEENDPFAIAIAIAKLLASSRWRGHSCRGLRLRRIRGDIGGIAAEGDESLAADNVWGIGAGRELDILTWMSR